ncbi:MAG TPA: hypothetical protein VFI68_11035 [Anaerolineales bacterium]|nr:hypothetical protein [Anaerolineales bacterium]
MNLNETHSGNPSASNWQVLGQLELMADSQAHGYLRDQLVEILKPLHLQENFLNKLLLSAEEYTTRALSSITALGHGHLHLVIFTQPECVSASESWGFFRIEKIDNAEQNPVHPDHVVEFYLYLEGL